MLPCGWQKTNCLSAGSQKLIILNPVFLDASDDLDDLNFFNQKKKKKKTKKIFDIDEAEEGVKVVLLSY